MNWILEYHERIKKEDLPNLPKSIKERVMAAIQTRLLTHPDLYGKPLRKNLKGCFKLRVGDYRIAFKLMGNRIRIFAIDHRSRIYQKALERLQYTSF